MSKRALRDNSDTGSLFPFLAVLLCTMGALLVLLVVLAQRAAERAVSDAIAQADNAELPESPAPIATPTAPEAKEVATLEQELDEVLKYQEQIKTRRAEAEKRLRDEKSRLSHLEEHTRRLEHELARLSIAANQLEATEKNQIVDQDIAESELKRLQSLIDENQERLEEIREQSKGKHSYAIVPYKGPNGTFRKPIYIECRKDGVFIHPEGLHFPESDFADTSWPGNPLAAALRATREYLNIKAAKAGEPEPPDPYPLLLVRPDGIGAYSAARAAITSWDSDYGYEFIGGDWKLDFPDLPDPLLAQDQYHAVLNARDKMALLARAAPSRFRGMGIGGSGANAYGGTSGSQGYGSGGQHDTSGASNSLANSSGEGSPNGNGLAAGQAKAHYSSIGSTGGDESGITQYGAMRGGNPGGEADGYQSAYGSLGATNEAGATAGQSGTSGEGQYAAGQTPQGTQQSGGAAQSPGGAAGTLAQGKNPNQSGPNQSGQAGSASGASSQGGSPGSAAANGQSAGALVAGSQDSPSNGSISNHTSSIAESQGRNWAIEQGRQGAVPIRRPIEVVVRKDQIALLPSLHVSQGAEATGAVVSLNQPINQISNEFVGALRSHIQQWGLAGNGLYWRPVLELKVGPDAQHTAYEITRLLKNSGVEVRLPEMANAGQGANTNAPK